MEITKELIDINDHTRPGKKTQPLRHVNGVVIHYVQWPGASAQRVRDYFNDLPKTEPNRFASAHYVVGLRGEVIQMIPEDECAWHAGPSSSTNHKTELSLGGKPNWRTIGIECCHPDASGKLTDETERATIELAADILVRHESMILLRHYDCTGKRCPRWYVDHESEWRRFVELTVQAARKHE